MTPPGRFCPADYRYTPASFARPADLRTETIYFVGGSYGNRLALDPIERMASSEVRPVDIVFNGDFHWFDANPERFVEVSRRFFAHRPLRGNVETELACVTDVGAACGCAYPTSIDDASVERSNRVLAELRPCINALPEERQRLASLPMKLVVTVGKLRIGIVHGDAESLAGWRFAHDALDAPAARTWLHSIRAASCIDVFASSHTCVPVLRDFALDPGGLTVINNGAAGMPNFHDTSLGVLTRVSIHPWPHAPLFGIERDQVFVEALPIRYDSRRWLREFVNDWPSGSPAYNSYFQRIVAGPPFSLNEVYGRAERLGATGIEVER